MPKRTNEFQSHRQGRDTTRTDRSRVTESAMLIDSVTGKKREVDGLIEVPAGPRILLIGVEVSAKGRPADIIWVEQMLKKHERLPTNRLVLVSRAGFTEDALEKARIEGAETLTWERAEEGAEWTKIVGKLSNIKIESTVRPFITGCTVLFDSATTQDSTLPSTDTLERGMIHSPDGQPWCTAGELAKALIEAPEVVAEADKADEGTWKINVVMPFDRGSYLVLPDGQQHRVVRLEVSARCHKATVVASLEHVRYGPVMIATGRATTVGHPVDLVITEQKGQPAVITVRVARARALQQSTASAATTENTGAFEP